MDQGIKRLLQARPQDVLTLALPGVEYLAPMPTDVATEPQLVLDTLYQVRYQGEECAVNIEAQAYPDAATLLRVWHPCQHRAWVAGAVCRSMAAAARGRADPAVRDARGIVGAGRVAVL
jgi:hypothetical protein